MQLKSLVCSTFEKILNMITDHSPNDLLEADNTGIPVPTKGLKILTILTFIGSILAAIGYLYTYISAQSNYEGREKLMDQLTSGTMPS